jgi:hypothetical protein
MIVTNNFSFVVLDFCYLLCIAAAVLKFIGEGNQEVKSIIQESFIFKNKPYAKMSEIGRR